MWQIIIIYKIFRAYQQTGHRIEDIDKQKMYWKSDKKIYIKKTDIQVRLHLPQKNILQLTLNVKKILTDQYFVFYKFSVITYIPGISQIVNTTIPVTFWLTDWVRQEYRKKVRLIQTIIKNWNIKGIGGSE